MSSSTAISWCDSTFNPWMGCTKVSSACDHCYAERDMDIRLGKVRWGAGQPRQRTGVKNWNLPLRWNAKPYGHCPRCGWRGEYTPKPIAGVAECDGCGEGEVSVMLEPTRRRVFCASLADWMDNEVPSHWLVDLLDLIRRTPNLDWLLLSKRIGNWRTQLMLAIDWLATSDRVGTKDTYDLLNWMARWLHGEAPANIWIGATIVDQQELDRDLVKLYRVPAVVRFTSAEPLLSPLSFDPWAIYDERGFKLLHWIIAGGESGPHARPMHPDWIRSLRDQCAAAGVAFHFKQWGEWAHESQLEFVPANAADFDSEGCPKGRRWHFWTEGDRGANASFRMGKKAAGRLLDGREHNEFPGRNSTAST